jgi:outer membrane protein assembly factor BamE
MTRRPERSRALAGVRALRFALPVVALLALGGCSLDRWTPRTYEPPLQQGNVIEPDAVAKLKPGMTRSQVRFLLGTPMVVDVFRTDRWDYVYLHKRQGEPTRQRRLAVFFEADLLARVETDAASPGAATRGDAGVVPAKDAGAGTAATGAPGAQVPPAPAVPAKPPGSAPAATPGAAAPAAADAAAQPASQRGFFGRMLERIGL